jgi:DNA-binding transcriptional regulator GbsR (MarR family)
LCKKLEPFGEELIAIDGSKFKASNSKKQNFNQAKLRKAIKVIEEKIDAYLPELEEKDEEEAHICRPRAEDIKTKVMMLKERGRKYRELLRELEVSGETQVSLTDPDSRAQRVEVCYNV